MDVTPLWILAILALCAVPLAAQDLPDWYRTDPLARELSQLDETEARRFTGTELVDVRPVVLPTPDLVVGPNDYFMWPIATIIEDTQVVLYARSPAHWGPQTKQADGNGGIRMVVTSSDGGETWGQPVDVLKSGQWPSDSWGCNGFGAGLGVHDGVVYLALAKGVYKSLDRGRTWQLVCAKPVTHDLPDQFWAPGMRLTFDETHGLTIWTTTGYGDYEARYKHGQYGDHLTAIYSPDYGTNWYSEQQALPDGLRLSEVTPVQFDGGKLAFFLRNGIRDTCYGQGYSAGGWFPFSFGLTNVGPVGIVDTPDVNYNPVTGRLEAAASHRKGTGPGPTGALKVNLYSIAPADLAAGGHEWRYDGTLVRYRGVFGKSDGCNPVGSVIDVARGRQYLHFWGGDCQDRAGIFQYSRSLDTDAVREYLLAQRQTE